jgi:negative regulator of sigma E activity
VKLILLLMLCGLAVATRASSQSLPTADEIVSRMMERESQRQVELHSYSGFRRYVLKNQRHHKRAEMLVRMNCLDDGSKEFSTVSETGWGGARHHVFPRLLESEREASLPDNRERSRITPSNYSFRMIREDTAGGRRTYVLAITPKTENKYLIRGTIWVDADEYAIVRIEGEPAKNPSFWIKNVHFVHTYQKNGPLWLPASDRSVTDARIFGPTEVTIDYFSYVPTLPMVSRSQYDRNY